MPVRLYPLLRPLLLRLDPERAHALTLWALERAYSLGVLAPLPAALSAPVTLMGLRFPNRLGLAAGLDKNARHVDALGALGFGCVEVGTVTPRAQAGQVPPRLFRLIAAQALINRMGFPNDGAAVVAARLARRAFAGVCGVNIGKNASTPMSAAAADYLQCLRVLAPHADYIAINVSSPNTTDLRRLQDIEQLRPMLEMLLAERERLHASAARRVPLLLKISPDLGDDELLCIAQLVRALRIDGVIATNTTVTRPQVAQLRWGNEAGGLSGVPLRPLMLRVVRVLRTALDATTPIIAVGGIASGRDALDALRAGADLVQVYTALIYRGPPVLREILASLRNFERAAS